MAKYTELLSEYLEEGGQLPALFDTIAGFTDLFVGEYCDREIGFETPTLFSVKLEQRAALVIPSYSQRITDLDAARELILNPNKKTVQSGNLTRDRGGEIKHDNETFEQPFAVNNEPPALTQPAIVNKETESYNAYQETESYNDITHSESGFSSSEALAIAKHFDEDKGNILSELLGEFSGLFMEVF